MTTLDYNFQSTRDELIAAAYAKIGAIPQGATATASQVTAASGSLNRIVKGLQTKGIFLWTLKDIELQLVVGQANYVIGAEANIIGIHRAFYRYEGAPGDGSNTIDEPELQRLSWVDYQSIPDKEKRGTPVYISLSPLNSQAYLYPVPDDTNKVWGVWIAKLKDFDSASSTGDFPAKYELLLLYELSHSLSEDYGLPMQEQMAYRARADEELRRALTSDSTSSDFVCVESAF